MKFTAPPPSSGYDRTNEAGFRQRVEHAFGQAAAAVSVNMLASFVKADMPDPVPVPGLMIFVTDETGGAVPAFSDGTNWRRVTDRAVVS